MSFWHKLPTALRRVLVWGPVVALILGLLLWFAARELATSNWQARELAELGAELGFRLEPGGAKALPAPVSGPYDERLGYSQMAAFAGRLERRGFAVAEQARPSDRLRQLTDLGLFPAYHEKDQGGLALADCRGQSLYATRYPERIYESFESIPPLLVDTLLFIENRELLDTRNPTRNPAVEWDRFAKAAADQLVHFFNPGHEAPGGSTLATQIEKYRHSPEGRTKTGKEKLRQMASASVRAYLDGEDTTATRRRIVVGYLNTVPLSAKPGFGEVNGLGDGLWAWYGRDFGEVNRLLGTPAHGAPEAGGEDLLRQALAYKQTLSLMIAQRRPSHYLAGAAANLEDLTDSHLRVLAEAGVIQPALRDAALAVKLRFREDPAVPPPPSFVTRKAATTLRTHLGATLGVPRFYDLDRLDLSATSTLHADVQAAVTKQLRDLSDPARARAAGLYGFHLLAEGQDPGKIVLSFTLFERGAGGNLLRVQTDNYDQPFDINEGARLDLGSTAKLRTLVTYLEIITELHAQYAKRPAEELRKLPRLPRNQLRNWALDTLAKDPNMSLRAMLEAAMDRKYSASPGEAFFTGGGLHTFHNFEPEDNGKIMPVREALRNSVNLVFIRMMRDIVYYYMYKDPQASATLLDDAGDPRRKEYLARFADREGRTYIVRFFKKYQGRTAEEASDLLFQGMNASPRRMAVILRSIDPKADGKQFAAAMRARLGSRQTPSDDLLEDLYGRYGEDKFSLPDRGYLAGIHPLELWLLAFLREHPAATLNQVLEASRDERQAVYDWLFRTRHKNAQDVRIKGLLEVEAFLEIGRAWRRLGYPFESLTPSYATSIGSSADRPAALAELMGIIVNKGIRLPAARIESLHFAAATPYEARFVRHPAEGERVLPEELTEVVRNGLLDVVDRGTARRLKGAFVAADGRPVAVGGKTGTGDHRYEEFGRGGQLLESRVVSRSATFVFLIGEHLFGTLTAYVGEPYAARYEFTSAFATQLLKTIAPTLTPLLPEGNRAGRSACAAPA
jgi:membrane peptidoglycan carboxypeptidase